MASEMRTPIMIRAARSRPMASVPKKKCSRWTLTVSVPLQPVLGEVEPRVGEEVGALEVAQHARVDRLVGADGDGDLAAVELRRAVRRGGCA